MLEDEVESARALCSVVPEIVTIGPPVLEVPVPDGWCDMAGEVTASTSAPADMVTIRICIKRPPLRSWILGVEQDSPRRGQSAYRRFIAEALIEAVG